MVKVWFRELPSFQPPKLACENSMLGAFSGEITVVANDVIMQRTQRCLGLCETRQANRYIVIWLARALRALEASPHVIGLAKAQSHEIGYQIGWNVTSTAAEAPAKFQGNWKTIITYLVSARLCETLRWDVLCDIASPPEHHDHFACSRSDEKSCSPSKVIASFIIIS